MFHEGNNNKKNTSNSETMSQEDTTAQARVGENHSLVDLGEPYCQPSRFPPAPAAPNAAPVSPVNMYFVTNKTHLHFYKKSIFFNN